MHEAYLRLMPPDHVAGQKQLWEGRAHIFAAAAEAMRRILVERARRKRRLKHGGNLNRHSANDLNLAVEVPPDDVLAVDESLEKLAEVDSQAAKIVKLAFFRGHDTRRSRGRFGHFQPHGASGLGIRPGMAGANAPQGK